MNNFKEKAMKIVFLLTASFSILAVALICVFLFANGIPAIKEIGLPDFLLGTKWKPGNNLYGIFPMILGSIYVTAGAIVVGVPIGICITKISTFLILCDLAVCLATLYVSFSLVFALMRYLQGKVFLIRFYSPTTLSSSRAEFRLPSRLACA